METMTDESTEKVIASHKVGFRNKLEITSKGLRDKDVNIPYSQIRECIFVRRNFNESPIFEK